MKLLKMFYRFTVNKPKRTKVRMSKTREVNIPYYEAWHDEIGKPKKAKRFDIPLPPVFLN